MKNITQYIIIGFLTLLSVFVTYNYTELLQIKSTQTNLIKPITERLDALENVNKEFTSTIDELRAEQTKQFVTFTQDIQSQINGYAEQFKAIKSSLTENNTKSEQLGGKLAEAIKNFGSPKNYDKEIADLKQSVNVINQKLQ